MRENRNAHKIFMLCYRQTLDIQMGGPKDLDFGIVNDMIDRYAMPWKQTFEKVVAVSRHMFKIWNDEMEAKRKSDGR